MRLNNDSLRWHPSDCGKCIVPDILNANASPDLELKVTASNRLLGFGRKVEVEAFCHGKPIPVEEAYTGCGEARPGLDAFRRALEDIEDDD